MSGYVDGWMVANDSSWKTEFDSPYAIQSDNDWLSSIWGYTKSFSNSQVGSGLIQGAAGAALSMYNQNEQQEAFEKTREDTNAWREEQLAFQREQLAAQIGMQQAVLDDKINTRRRHNESINAKPNNAKSIKFG